MAAKHERPPAPKACDAAEPGQEPPQRQQRRAAYTRIVREYEAGLLRAARRLTSGDEDRAQDLVQDALVRGYEAYVNGRFREGSDARAWLLRILTNGFLNDRKRRQRWEAPVDWDALTSGGETALTAALEAAAQDRPDAALLAGTLDEPLERALAALSPLLRACVVLVDVEGLEYADAAAALGIPIGTVRSRLARARLQMHALLFGYARERRRV
jgi:RNA polymerase sigma-70 factor, ECF subfamily